jgi:hypothetical protein
MCVTLKFCGHKVTFIAFLLVKLTALLVLLIIEKCREVHGRYGSTERESNAINPGSRMPAAVGLPVVIVLAPFEAMVVLVAWVVEAVVATLVEEAAEVELFIDMVTVSFGEDVTLVAPLPGRKYLGKSARINIYAGIQESTRCMSSLGTGIQHKYAFLQLLLHVGHEHFSLYGIQLCLVLHSCNAVIGQLDNHFQNGILIVLSNLSTI